MSYSIVYFRLGGSLKRSLGMVNLAFTIPKAFGFETATLPIFMKIQLPEPKNNA